MLGNMFNDLAKAIRRWTEKNKNSDKLNVPDDRRFCGLISGVMHLTWPSMTRVYDSDRSNDTVTFKPRLVL